MLYNIHEMSQSLWILHLEKHKIIQFCFSWKWKRGIYSVGITKDVSERRRELVFSVNFTYFSIILCIEYPPLMAEFILVVEKVAQLSKHLFSLTSQQYLVFLSRLSIEPHLKVSLPNVVFWHLFWHGFNKITPKYSQLSLLSPPSLLSCV